MRNAVETSPVDPELPSSTLFEIRDTPHSGRGIFATTTIPAGTRLLASSDVSLYVIFRDYRKEVCSWCFAYDDGRTLNVRNNAAGIVWCTDECRAKWVEIYGDVALEGMAAVNKAWKPKLKTEEEGVDTDQQRNASKPAVPTSDEISAAWTAAETSAELVRMARSSPPGKAPKSARKAMSAALAHDLDPDHLTYQLYCVLFVWAHQGKEEKDTPSSSTWKAFLSLASSSTPYISHDMLSQHIAAYLFLLAVLPPALLDSCNPSTLLNIISTDTFNSFGIRSLTDDGAEMFGFGCWPSASYWNHSCEPNVRKWREDGVRGWVFESRREIKEGEECCISYLGGEEEVLRLEGRRGMLQGAWGFECGCRKCVNEAGGGS